MYFDHLQQQSRHPEAKLQRLGCAGDAHPGYLQLTGSDAAKEDGAEQVHLLLACVSGRGF